MNQRFFFCLAPGRRTHGKKKTQEEEFYTLAQGDPSVALWPTWSVTTVMRASCTVVPRTAPNGGGFEESPAGPILLLSWYFLPSPAMLDDQAFVIVRRCVLDATVAPAVAHRSWGGGHRR